MRPLEGKTIVTTQPADQATAMVNLLETRGAKALNLPMIETRTTFVKPELISAAITTHTPRLLVFTSKKGVKGWFKNLHNTTGTYQLPKNITIATVGESTAFALKQYGHHAHHINPGNDARDLAEYLLEMVLQPGDEVMLALGNKAPSFLENALAEKAVVSRINVYETIMLDQTGHPVSALIRENRVHMCIFTSPSGFGSFAGQFAEHMASVHLAAIGTTTARAIMQAGRKVHVVASQPSPESLSQSIESFYQSLTKT